MPNVTVTLERRTGTRNLANDDLYRWVRRYSEQYTSTEEQEAFVNGAYQMLKRLEAEAYRVMADNLRLAGYDFFNVWADGYPRYPQFEDGEVIKLETECSLVISGTQQQTGIVRRG